MATKTAGTKATTSLTAIQWNAQVSAADLATINLAMRNPIVGGFGASAAFASGLLASGQLTYPDGRGTIQLTPGDWVMVDGAGWPVVVPNPIFSTSWQHS